MVRLAKAVGSRDLSKVTGGILCCGLIKQNCLWDRTSSCGSVLAVARREMEMVWQAPRTSYRVHTHLIPRCWTCVGAGPFRFPFRGSAGVRQIGGIYLTVFRCKTSPQMKNTLKNFGVCSSPTLLKRERRVVGNKYNKLMEIY